MKGLSLLKRKVFSNNLLLIKRTKTFKLYHLLFVLKTDQTLEIFKKQNVSLSSLDVSGYWIEFALIEFIEKHSLEKLHVRGRFRFPDTSGSRIFAIRTDFDSNQRVMKMYFRICSVMKS